MFKICSNGPSETGDKQHPEASAGEHDLGYPSSIVVDAIADQGGNSSSTSCVGPENLLASSVPSSSSES